MLPFFSFHPSKELPLSPPHHHRRKTIASITIPMKRGSHTGCDCRPAGTALGCCQGLRRDALQLLQLTLGLAWSEEGDRAARGQAGRGTCRPTILRGLTRVSSVQDDPWCASLLLEMHASRYVFLFSLAF